MSQLFANIYMNVVDQFIKRKLGVEFFVRYADDMVLIVKNREKATEILNILRKFIKDNLNLDINENKSKIFPINQGINAIGYKIYPTHMLLRNDSKKRIKRKIKAIPHLINEKRITTEKAEQILNSWKGHANYSCSNNFIKNLIKKYDFIYVNDKNAFKINRKKVLNYVI